MSLALCFMPSQRGALEYHGALIRQPRRSSAKGKTAIRKQPDYSFIAWP